MKTIYILSYTYDDGNTWVPQLSLGYFEKVEHAQAHADRLNRAETGELSRFEVFCVEPVDTFVY